MINPCIRGLKFSLISVLTIIAFQTMGPLAYAKQTNDAQIKTWPEPQYPMIASWLRLEGHCEVRFSVDEKGFPFAVSPFCTRPIFCFEAKRAVSDATFYPKRVDGVPTERLNLVFPLEFAFEESGYTVEDDTRSLAPCDHVAVS